MKYILILALLATICNFDCQSQDLVPFQTNNLWGYKDKEGNIKIQPQYQYATKFMFDAAIVAKNDTLAVIDKNNNLIIPFKYQFLRPLDTSEFLFGYRAVYYGEYNMGVITKDQKIKIAPEYRYISKYKGYYTITKHLDSIMSESPTGDVRSVKSFYGLLDNNGKVLIPCKFDYLSWMDDSLILLRQGNNQALYNSRGEQLTDFVYMVIDKFYEGLAKARIGDKFGFIHPNGKVAIPIKFDYCEAFNKGYSFIKQKDKWGAMYPHGERHPRYPLNEL